MRVAITHIVSWLVASWGILTVHAAVDPILQDHEVRLARLASRQTNQTAALPPPSYDAWYRAPAGWESKAPGDVLKVRAHAYPTINVKNCIDTFQILYRSSDTHGNASWAVSTVFVPTAHAGCNATNLDACAHAIVSYLIPYDSTFINASPSYLLQFDDPYGELTAMLGLGWFVMVPDFEGPLAAYCTGVQAGYASIDASRSVLKVAGDFGLRMDKVRHGMWGYSGGAFAAGFVAELAPAYAPELRIDGIIVGGPAPNFTTVNLLMNKRDTAGLVIAALIGITTQYPAATQHLLNTLNPTGPFNATNFFAAKYMSGVQALVYYANQDVFAYFKNGSADVFAPIMVDLYNKEGMMGYHGVPTLPVFVYKAIQDEMSPVNETDEYVAKLCAQGANILYHRNTLGGHNQELWAARNRVFDYLSTIFDDTGKIPHPKEGCQTVEVSVPWYDAFPGLVTATVTGSPSAPTPTTLSTVQVSAQTTLQTAPSSPPTTAASAAQSVQSASQPVVASA